VYIGVIGNDQSTFRDTFDGHEGEYTGYLSHARRALKEYLYNEYGDNVLIGEAIGAFSQKVY
jgi:hypothetical protein